MKVLILQLIDWLDWLEWAIYVMTVELEWRWSSFVYFEFTSQFFHHVVQRDIQDLKNEISQQSKKNFKLDKDLRFFDSRIALLINHKITVEVRIC